MLANGILLGFRLPGGQGEYTDLPELKEVPDLQNKPERVENTPLNAANKRYDKGIGDPGEMVYKFCYHGPVKGSTIVLLQPYAATDTELDFQETWPDGTIIQYAAVPNLSFARGGGINSIVDLQVEMFVTSDIETILPDEGGHEDE